MTRWTKDQLLRPAKHLTLGIPRVARNSCHTCGGNIHSGNEFGLCKECTRNDPGAKLVKKIRRRQSDGGGYAIMEFDPARPTCYYCESYRQHRCAFGFPESDYSRNFAAECLNFIFKPATPPTPDQPLVP